MQNSYKEYIKPEAFVGEVNQGEIVELLGFMDGINDFGTENSLSSLTEDDVNAHRTIYNKFAITTFVSVLPQS